MDTTPIAAGALARPTVGMLHCGDSPATPIAAELRYTSTDPYAITLILHYHGQAMRWIFARVLLSRGLVTPTGDGDVHVWPGRDDEGHAIVSIELCSRQGQALIELPTAHALDFTMRTHTIVAPGREWRHLDIDAAVAAINAAETS